MKFEYSELEKRWMRAKELGEDHAGKYELWMELDETKHSVLADIMNDIAKTDKDASEAKIKRLALSDEVYKGHCRNLARAKGEELRAKVRYECSIGFAEAGRTRESTRRAEMQLLREQT